MQPESPAAPGEPSISRAAWWLVHEGRLATTPGALLDGLCRLLNQSGMDLIRMSVELRTLHPEVELLFYVWRPREAAIELPARARVVEEDTETFAAGVVHHVALAHGAFATDGFQASPFHVIHRESRRVRCRIPTDATTFEFPILADLHAKGGTDYVALPARFNSGAVSALSYVTRKPGGFTDEELAGLEALLPALILCLEIHAARHATRTLLTTYVGREAGERVLAGKVQRGDVERVTAAIWFSDMRGFTTLSAALDSAELIRWLNEYFGAIAGPISQGNGEILKFIGDAVLAVFPITAEHPASEVCLRALTAARAANAALDALNSRRSAGGLPAIEHGIALHVGEVQYGNIGAERRLDFTVIGQAVNLASRIEGLCGKLGRRTLTSSAVASLAADEVERLGTFDLKGISEPQDVFGVRG
jgi:adenylate cyclase